MTAKEKDQSSGLHVIKAVIIYIFFDNIRIPTPP